MDVVFDVLVFDLRRWRGFGAISSQGVRPRHSLIARTPVSYLGVHRVALDRVAAAHLDGLGDRFGVFARARDRELKPEVPNAEIRREVFQALLGGRARSQILKNPYGLSTSRVLAPQQKGRHKDIVLRISNHLPPHQQGLHPVEPGGI